ncbi:MAG: serine protein kinase RIO [Thaumarchaeota archaeon]|nr:serine protein kinase RIO [Nitrososphaerota archaeon]
MRRDKLRERLLRYQRESRFLVKDSNDMKVIEEVFDKPTLLALYELLKKGAIVGLNGVVRAGKEARVYWGVGPDKIARAVKIYLAASMQFRRRVRYIAGDHRFGRIPSSSRGLINLWVQKEFKNLRLAHDAGVRVPRPHDYNENILIMEYIGSPPAPAPTFAEAEVDNLDLEWTIEAVRKLYRKAELVHADLSEFNIFKHEGERVLFDMGSAVSTSHPEAKQFLRRDLFNMVHFFRKRGIPSEAPEVLLGEVTG